jgi:hypothetical protein
MSNGSHPPKKAQSTAKDHKRVGSKKAVSAAKPKAKA